MLDLAARHNNRAVPELLQALNGEAPSLERLDAANGDAHDDGRKRKKEAHDHALLLGCGVCVDQAIGCYPRTILGA